MLSTAKKRQSTPVPICLQNLRNSPAHLETSSSYRSGRPGGPKIGRDTPGANINWFQAIPDYFRHFWIIVHFRSFWSFWWLGARYDLDFRSRANLSLILTHCNSNQSNSVLSTAKKRQSPPVPICLQNLRHSPGVFGDILWLSFWTSRSSRNCPGLTYHSYQHAETVIKVIQCSARLKNASPHQSQFVSKISDTLQHIWRHPLVAVLDVQEVQKLAGTLLVSI